ncbi:MAG TPA: hypothetical protein PLH72_03965 [Vicinamibacterales bacterium]|nr:hypothetical protein [Vicinamibacterales bacterium]
MLNRAWGPRLLVSAALGLMAAAGVRGAAQSAEPFVGTLDEHPAIGYATRAPADRVARLAQALEAGTRTLTRDAAVGYLPAVLDALGISVESQLLVFSKTGVQRDFTGPQNPRALYFDDAVVVGYIRGAPLLEIAAHDPQQGVMFYTLDQTADASPLVRRTECLTCHIAVSTLEVPGVIDRSHTVGTDGNVITRLGVQAVTHQTPHPARWGGWFVTAEAAEAPPYIQLGHMGNLTVTVRPDLGPAIYSNHVFIEWLNSAPEAHGYPLASSDIGSLLTFDHQMHAINLLTRLNWEARIAASEGRGPATDAALRRRVFELADYLLFVGEAPFAVAVAPRPAFAAHLASHVPADATGRSLGQLDLETRLLKYPCSYMVYSEAFEGLPAPVKDAVYRRMFDILSGRITGPAYEHLSAEDRRAVSEILRETKPGLPADLRTGGSRIPGR